MLARPDSRKHQRLWRAERAARNDHRPSSADRPLLVALANDYARRAPIFDQDALDQRAGLDM